MRDRGFTRVRSHDVTPVGAHSVGDRDVGRPRSGLLRARSMIIAIVRRRGRA